MRLPDVIERASVMEGFLIVNVFERGKKIDEFRLIEHWPRKNVLVNNIKTLISHLIAGDTANKFVTKIGFGTSGTAAAPSDTALTGMYSRAIGTVSYPTSSSVQWAWQLDTGEANGVAILEFGLLSATNELVARRARVSPINKTSDISLSGTWGINF